jgi:plasmid stabilization system protein ParE
MTTTPQARVSDERLAYLARLMASELESSPYITTQDREDATDVIHALRELQALRAERRWVTNLDAAAEHLYRVTAAAAGFTKHPEWQELAEQTRVTYYVEAVLRKKHEAFLPPPPQGDGRE